MNGKRDAEEYTNLFIQFSNSTQRFFKKTLVVLLVALCLCQALLRIPAVRAVLSSAERWEGEEPKMLVEPLPVQQGN